MFIHGLASFPTSSLAHQIFSTGLIDSLIALHQEFESERQELLQARKTRQAKYDQGALPTFETHPAQMENWSVAPIPKDLLDRRVEITGPISNAKMVINMLSANQDGVMANTAMLDFEDSMAPTWENVLAGFKNILAVADKSLSYTQKNPGGEEKTYSLNPHQMALPMVRVRGIHLDEKSFLVSGTPISASLLDLVVTAALTSRTFIAEGITPKFYVPKCEHYLEARWWNKLFSKVESLLGLENGKIKVTFLIETLPAAFQMEEILYEIRNRACGLNGGRWDKIFSDIKTLKMHSDRVMADRASIDMTRPWMENYAKLLIKTCHKHGAFAMGGMSAFTPGSDEATRRIQLEKVRKDKEREASIGHDGCWVSHPFFISMASEQFKKTNQLDVMLSEFPERPDLYPKADGPKTLKGLRQNIRVGIAYQMGWNKGMGCIAFENLMEDLATLEISRAQVWQWLHHKIHLDDGITVTPELVETIFEEEFTSLKPEYDGQEDDLLKAKNQIKQIYLQKDLVDFYTNI